MDIINSLPYLSSVSDGKTPMLSMQTVFQPDELHSKPVKFTNSSPCMFVCSIRSMATTISQEIAINTLVRNRRADNMTWRMYYLNIHYNYVPGLIHRGFENPMALRLYSQ